MDQLDHTEVDRCEPIATGERYAMDGNLTGG